MNGFYDPLVYDARAQGVPGDVEFFLGLAHEAHAAGHPGLELSSRPGPLAIPLAHAGLPVFGPHSPLAHARPPAPEQAHGPL